VDNEPVADWGNGAISTAAEAGGGLDAACVGIFPKPFIDASSPTERIVKYFSTSTTTSTLQNAGRATVTTAATTTTTRPKEERVMGPHQANIVLNVFYNQSVSPYLNGEKDQNQCESILHRLRKGVSDKGTDWNLFSDAGNLGEVMMCNIVYGWALGEYCASGLDEVNAPYIGAQTVQDSSSAQLSELDAKLAAMSAQIRADARAKCENVTRTQCDAVFVGDNNNVVERVNTDAANAGLDNAGVPPFMYDSSDGTPGARATEIDTMIEEMKTNPCFMKTGYGQSPINGGRMFGSFNIATGGTTAGFIVPGTGQNPSVGTAFFKNHKGDAATLDAHRPNHFVDLGKGATSDETLFNSYDLDEDFQTVSVSGDPGDTFVRYNVRTSTDGADGAVNLAYATNFDGATLEFPRVQVPITQVDSRYIYERFVYDFLVLGQMADAVGREQDFYNMLPAECFSDGSGSNIRAGTRFIWTVFLVTLILFLLPRFFVVAYLTEGYGYTLPLPKTGQIISEATHTKIVFLLSMITGILGFSISMAINPDGPGAHDGETSGLQSWAAVLDAGAAGNGILQEGDDYSQGDNTALHRTYHFLIDIANGNYHRAYGLDEDEQYNAYILSIMCAMITTLGVIMILFKRVGSGEGEAVLSKGKLIGDWA
jgi:hypothetical protein